MSRYQGKRVDVEKISQIDFARLAAFIDGEGCFRIQASGHVRRNRYHALRLVIGQADVRLMVWLEETFGGTYLKGSGGTNRPMWYWMLNSHYMLAILQRTMPYLILKREQAEIFLQWRTTLTKGRTPLTDETIQKRETLKSRLTLLKHPERATA